MDTLKNLLKMNTLRFGIKLGMATGAAYYIADQGVWKSSEEAVEICSKITENVSPLTKEISNKIPYELPDLPQSEEISFLAKHYWNLGVKTSFKFLADLPATISDLTDKGINFVTESKEFKNVFNSNQPEEIEHKELKPEKL